MADHQPYIPASQSPAELTARSLVLGSILGLIFGASNVYLALKIGLTVSASIPIAVLSITIFRALGRATILENNIVQTTGSAADSVSAGVVFTIPAILLMGYDLDIERVAILALAGGLMGILMMIPLRRALIVKEHGNLPYPEGTACAEVLIAGEKGGVHAKTVFQAFGIAFVYKFLMTALKLWQEYPNKVLRWFQGAEVRMEVSPELMGVGYIIGPRIAGYLFAGGCLAYVVLMPTIKPADRREPAGRGAHHRVRLHLHHRVVADLRADRQLGEPRVGDDDRLADRDLVHLPALGMDPDRRPRARDLPRLRHRGSGGERWQHLAGPENRLPRGGHSPAPADRDPGGGARLRPGRRLDAHVPQPVVPVRGPRSAGGLHGARERPHGGRQRRRAERVDVPVPASADAFTSSRAASSSASTPRRRP